MDIKKWFEDQKIESVQDRQDGMDYWKNYELFTYNDLMECLEALYSITAVVQAKPEVCDHEMKLVPINFRHVWQCTKCGHIE